MDLDRAVAVARGGGIEDALLADREPAVLAGGGDRRGVDPHGEGLRGGVAGVAGIVDHGMGHRVVSRRGESVPDRLALPHRAVAEVPAVRRDPPLAGGRQRAVIRRLLAGADQQPLVGARDRRLLHEDGDRRRRAAAELRSGIADFEGREVPPVLGVGVGGVAAWRAGPVAETPDEVERIAFDVAGALAGERDGASASRRRRDVDHRDRPLVEREQPRRQLERQEPPVLVGDVERRVVGIFLAAAERHRDDLAAVALRQRDRRRLHHALAGGDQRIPGERRGDVGLAEGGVEIAHRHGALVGRHPEAELGQHTAPRHADGRVVGEHLGAGGRDVLRLAGRECDVVDVAVRTRQRVDHQPEDDPVVDPLAVRRIEGRQRHPLAVGLPLAAEGLLGELRPCGELGLGQHRRIGGFRDEGALAAEDGELRARRRREPVQLVVAAGGLGVEDADVERTRGRRRDAQVDRLVMVVVALPDRGRGTVVDEQRLAGGRFRLLAVCRGEKRGGHRPGE